MSYETNILWDVLGFSKQPGLQRECLANQQKTESCHRLKQHCLLNECPQLIKEFHLWQLNTNALNRSYEYVKLSWKYRGELWNSAYTMVNRLKHGACVEHADSLKVLWQNLKTGMSQSLQVNKVIHDCVPGVMCHVRSFIYYTQKTTWPPWTNGPSSSPPACTRRNFSSSLHFHFLSFFVFGTQFLKCFGSLTAMFNLGHILENLGMGRVFCWLLLWSWGHALFHNAIGTAPQ